MIDKVSSRIMYLNRYIKLLLRVDLAKPKYGDKSRDYHYKEWQYRSDQYTDCRELISAKLEFTYSLMMEVNAEDEKLSIRLRHSDIARLTLDISKIIKFMSIPDVYVEDKSTKRIFLNAKYNNIEFNYRTRYTNMVFKPAVLIDEEDNTSEGMLLSIKDSKNTFELSVDAMYSLWYVLRTTDFYTASLQLVSFIGKPEGSKYLHKVEASYRNDQSGSEVQAFNIEKGRKFGQVNKDEFEEDFKIDNSQRTLGVKI